jgi:hypothetical protein
VTWTYWRIWWLWLLIAPLATGETLPPDSNETYERTKKLPDLHHVVGVELPDDMKTPKHLKLRPDRVLRCPTCHGIDDIDKTPYRRVNRKAENFLRGGPYRDLDRFCYECHDEEEFKRPNIHIMVDKNGKAKEEHCTYCHEELHEDRTKPLPAFNYKLRLPPEILCYGCHLKTPHFNAAEHQSVKPGEKMKKHMGDSKREQGVILPLSQDGKVMCSTCHNPHQTGVFETAKNPAGKAVTNRDLEEGIVYRDEHPWNAVFQADKKDRLAAFNEKHGERVSLEYRRIEKEALLRLPAKDGTLCLACHVFDH